MSDKLLLLFHDAAVSAGRTQHGVLDELLCHITTFFLKRSPFKRWEVNSDADEQFSTSRTKTCTP